MNKIEADEILSEQINKLRKLSYLELSRFTDVKNIETPEITGKSETKYQLEIQAIWDDKPKGNLRVMVSIDDGGWRAFAPLTDDFIITPNGYFVGEQGQDVT